MRRYLLFPALTLSTLAACIAVSPAAPPHGGGGGARGPSMGGGGFHGPAGGGLHGPSMGGMHAPSFNGGMRMAPSVSHAPSFAPSYAPRMATPSFTPHVIQGAPQIQSRPNMVHAPAPQSLPAQSIQSRPNMVHAPAPQSLPAQSIQSRPNIVHAPSAQSLQGQTIRPAANASNLQGAVRSAAPNQAHTAAAVARPALNSPATVGALPAANRPGAGAAGVPGAHRPGAGAAGVPGAHRPGAGAGGGVASAHRPGAGAGRPQHVPPSANAANWNRNHYHAYPWYRGSWRSGYGFPLWWGFGGLWGGGWGWGGLYGMGYGGPYPWLAPGSYYPYSNPYYLPDDGGLYDYAQPLNIPLMIPAGDEGDPNSDNAAPANPIVDEIDRALAVHWLKSARTAFLEHNYSLALDHANKAVGRLPSDPVVHEFRALTQFALGDYRAAASTLYPVVAAGPGWDWDTLKTFYSDVEEYTRHLRALEYYQRAHKTEPEPSFVLAYHYLSLNEVPAATRQLENVVALSPNDQLSKLLLTNLQKTKAPSPDQPQPQQQQPQQ